MTARVPAGVPTGGQFATSARPESSVALMSEALPEPLDVDDVAVGRSVDDVAPVVTRTDRAPIGSVRTITDPNGKKSWTPQNPDGEPLTYPVPGPDGTAVPRRYGSRAQAVRALVQAHNEATYATPDWATADPYDWAAQTYSYWNQRFTVAETLRDRPLLHGSPHPVEVGQVLLPDQAPTNFAQSDPFVVSLTTEPRLAHHWAADAARARDADAYYVYEVEPLTPVDLWRKDMEGWDLRNAPLTCDRDRARLVLEEGRVAAARVVSVTRIELSR